MQNGYLLFLCFHGWFLINIEIRELLDISHPYLIEHVKKCWGGVMRFAIFNIGTIPSNRLRKLIYRMLCGRIESNVTIHFRTEIRCPRRLTIGKGTIIGDNAILDARCGLTMGENVNLSSNVSIYTLQHDHRDP